ncbi:MAG TPA: trehalase family glycosidase, partial [Armatimonadota bacterium]
TPSFWDHAVYLDYRVAPLFTVTLFDEDGSEIALNRFESSWVPSNLTTVYQAEDDLDVSEQRALLPEDVLVSVLSITNSGDVRRKLRVILWTSQETSGAEQDVCVDTVTLREGVAGFRRRHFDGQGQIQKSYHAALGAAAPPTSHSFRLSEKTDNYPMWDYTPFFEGFTGKLDQRGPEDSGRTQDGLHYMGLGYTVTLDPGEMAEFPAGIALAPTQEEASQALQRALRSRRPIGVSEKAWEQWFRSVPSFTCSDPFLQTYYWYRWYGLRLNRVQDDSERLPYPCVFEGTNAGWFRHAISYSAQCHMLESRWMRSPALAEGTLLNFIRNQEESGAFPGCILNGEHEDPKGFYHANWGRAVRELYDLHRNRDFLNQVYEPLARYACYLSRERDREESHLYDVLDQCETGQEYMSRYLFVREDADDWGPIQLKGVDATVYAYELQRTLAWIAGKLAREAEEAKWTAAAEATAEAIRTRMYDPERGLFFDVHPKTGERSPAKAATCFYPLMTDAAGEEHLAALEHLLNPKEFWTRWPVPSTSQDDPTFNARGEWKGKRHACPWNGRTWLMTNSHIAEALGRASQELDRSLAPRAAEFLHRFIRMMFRNASVSYPTSYEYYNPETGQPPVFRGVDDYMHSWVVDLILKYVVGIQPGDEMLVIDPLPMGLSEFAAEGIPLRGKRLDVTWNASEGLVVGIDGKEVARKKKLGRIEIPLPSRKPVAK